ncbi:MAG: hypothetical protein LUF92_09935 [Clostridiales bacterium]|nr:hypothetical protein [Clostridiales bacterium]
MKKILKLFTVGLFVLALSVMIKIPVLAASHAAGEVIYYKGYEVGTYNAKGQIVYTPFSVSEYGSSAASMNSKALQTICFLEESKTIVIPSGSSVPLYTNLFLNDNTTIIATGADIYVTRANVGLIKNMATALNYQSVKNVTIDGGTWRTTDTTEGCSIIQFCHGSNVTIKNATIIANYESHCIELIAMQNVTVKNCNIKATLGTVNKKSVEEAVQIDIATPSTAPGIATETTRYGITYGGSKYVNGQTCKNITITGNTIKGSRGLCANFYSPSDNAKWRNKFHDNIKVTKNTLIGVSAEGCALYHKLNATVKNNVIRTNSTRTTLSYAVGLNISIQGKVSKKKMQNTKLVVSNNKVYGVRQGIQITNTSSASSPSRYAKVTVKKNTCYASQKANALAISTRAVLKRNLTSKKNVLKKRK